MKVILVGYPGSQFLVPASKYLAQKYLPGFDLHYLNYKGPKEGWSAYIIDYISRFDDEFIIFALDDYLLSQPINNQVYEYALERLKEDPEIVSIKLFECTSEEHEGYPVTTQYTIWRRNKLIELLSRTKDPWHFELAGSNIFRTMGWKSIRLYPALKYNANSALSARWTGIDLAGVKQEDIDYIKNNNLIK